MTDRTNTALKVSSFVLVGDEHEWLATVLRQWIGDGFSYETGAAQIAHRLLDELEARCLVLTEPRY